MDIRNFLSKFRLKLRGKTKGYVVLLLVVFVPLIMLGTKLALDLMTMHDTMINTRTSGPAYRKCAEKAALAVAQNWNPGRSLDHQKRAALKVADQVYNDGVNSIGNIPELAKAVPGIQLSVNNEVIIGKGFDPIRVKTRAIPLTINQIKYLSAPKYLLLRKIYPTSWKNGSPWNLPFVAWKLADKLTSADTTYDKFDELDQEEHKSGKYVLSHFDRYQHPHQWWVRADEGYPTRDYFSIPLESAMDVLCTLTSSNTSSTDESGYSASFAKNTTETNITYGIQSSVQDGIYTYREDENDNSVQVSVESDKIKVQADYDVGHAIPAECNVDIVLACPTNGAACNKNNRDQNSTAPEMPYTSASKVDTINADIQACPIYQIGQALRAFAKEFYHTKGVTMGLIPYSGKVSLDPDVANGYTWMYATRNCAYFDQGYYPEQNTYPAYLRGAALYDSYGLTNKELNNDYKWNTLLTACPIRCRAGWNDNGNNINDLKRNCGRNIIFRGNILSTDNPAGNSNSTNSSTMFFRQNSNPCYGGYANLLTMRCERNCTVYLPNPYYIIEPTADVQKIYEICGALYPFYDEYNVSNFLFIPITWANNLWQDWTRNPEHAAVDTDASGNGGQLEIPSKMKEGRKKVLILVVNKPDWFEPHELTYLGFDNDFSELCMIESDRIDFSQNYDDTSKKFADGTPYDGTIQGPKKILKFETTSGTITRNSDTGYYECESATATLSFPKKYLVKLVVESLDKIEWESFTNDCGRFGGGYVGIGPIKGMENLLVRVDWGGTVQSSSDGINWTNQGSAIASYSGPAYGNGIWCVAGNSYVSGGKYSIDEGQTWNAMNDNISYLGNIVFGNGVFMAFCGGVKISTNGKDWEKVANTPGNSAVLCYGNGKWICGDGNMYESRDNGLTWRFLDSSLKNLGMGSSNAYGGLHGGCYTGGYFYVINGTRLARSKSGRNWKKMCTTVPSGNFNINISCYEDKFYVVNEGTTFIGTPVEPGTITFSNLEDGAIKNNEAYDTNERREFYIEPSQMNGNSIDISLKNIRLISAEITNRPYKRQKAVCAFEDGTTNIKTNAKREITVKVNPFPHGTVTFSDIDDTEIANAKTLANADSSKNPALTGDGREIVSGEAIEIRKPTTFTFPEGCFSKKYNSDSAARTPTLVFSTQKLIYDLNKVKITSAVLKNQMLRIRGPRDFHCAIDYRDPSIGFGLYGSGNYGRVGAWHALTANRYFVYSLAVNWMKKIHLIFCGCTYNGNKTTLEYVGEDESVKNEDFAGGTQVKECKLLVPNDTHFFYMRSGGADYSGIIYWLKMYNLDDCALNSDNFGDTTTGLYLAEGTKKAVTETITNEDGTTTENIITPASNHNMIHFEGQGNLSVTAEPTGKKGIITYLAPNDSLIPMVLDEPQTITIDPDNFKYEKDDDGLYTIKLTCDNVELSDLKFIDKSDVFTWDKIRRPEMSRWIDYSQNPYTANLVSTDAKFTNYWEYSTKTGFYLNTKVEGNWAVMYFDDIPGDYSSITYSDSNYEIRHYRQGENDSDGTYGTYNPYPASGLNLLYTPLYMVHNDMLKNGKFSWSKYVGTANTFNLVLQTLTLPINTALYYAYHDNLTNEAEWYTNSKGEYEYDASEASKNVTKAACKKLKEDFGNNLRIYLIKYRKQTQYKHKITRDPKNYDYTYLDDCTAYKYDIDSEDDLKTTMKTIAADIRTFAGYKGAVNVVP